MAHQINVKALIKKNHRVDAKQLKASMKLREKLRELGISRTGQHLASPLRRRRVTISVDTIDPRTIRLPRRN